MLTKVFGISSSVAGSQETEEVKPSSLLEEIFGSFPTVSLSLQPHTLSQEAFYLIVSLGTAVLCNENHILINASVCLQGVPKEPVLEILKFKENPSPAQWHMTTG